jgi:ABC-type Co2+ transport system permease subunit
MYLPIGTVPAWLGVLGWLAAAASLAVALVRLRRVSVSVWTFAGAAALVAALRLLEFPLHAESLYGGTVAAVGLVVVVFGVEVGVCCLGAATLALGLVAPHVDGAALGANLLAHVAVAPWLVWWWYSRLKRVFASKAAGYVLAFAVGGAGAPLVAVTYLAMSPACGPVTAEAAWRVVAAGLALAAAEGVLAAWGYTLALSRRYRGDGRLERWVPRSWRGGFWMAVTAVTLAGAAAPWVPPYGGILGPMPALARAADVPFFLRAALGLATVGVGAALACSLFGAHKLSRLLSGNKKAGA